MVGHNPATKRTKLLINATTWRNLIDVMPSKGVMHKRIQTLFFFTKEALEQAKLIIVMKTTSLVARSEAWGEHQQERVQENFGAVEMFYISVVVIAVTWVHTFVTSTELVVK